MAENKNISPDKGIVREAKPSEPTSTINIEVLEKLEEFLLPIWRQTVHEENPLKGINVIDLFDLDKLNKFKFGKIRDQLSILPTDTFEYLKYERRRVQKKSKRHSREEKQDSSNDIDQSDISILQWRKQKYLGKQRKLSDQISFYIQEMGQFNAIPHPPQCYIQYNQFQECPQQRYNEYNPYNQFNINCHS